MKQVEIMTLISNMEKELAALKELVAAEESVNEAPVETEETPVIEEDVVAEEDITLPDPPAEVVIDLPEEDEDDGDAILGCQIINHLGSDFYDGNCRALKLYKQYFDNGQPKLYINKYKVVVVALNYGLKEIGRVVTHWNNLSKFHVELIKRGINTHKGPNWKPTEVYLDLD